MKDENAVNPSRTRKTVIVVKRVFLPRGKPFGNVSDKASVSERIVVNAVSGDKNARSVGLHRNVCVLPEFVTRCIRARERTVRNVLHRIAVVKANNRQFVDKITRIRRYGNALRVVGFGTFKVDAASEPFGRGAVYNVYIPLSFACRRVVIETYA